MDLRGLAIAWFRKEDWPRWRAIDPDFEPDYDYWLGRSEDALRRIGASQRVEKVIIDPDEFLKWSAAHGGQVNSNARSKYAAIILAERDRRQSH